MDNSMYRQISNVCHNKFQNLNASRLVLQLRLRNPWKPFKSRIKMYLEQCRQVCSNYIWMINNIITHYSASPIRGFLYKWKK